MAQGRRREYAPPRNETEASLAAIWAEILGVDRVGIHEDFFVLGGDSLLATRLIARVREVLSAVVTMLSFFEEASTVAGMAETIAACSPEADTISSPGPLPPGSRHELSFAQERLWFLQKLSPDDCAYNRPAAVFIRGRLESGLLSKSLDMLVGRHEVLRTVFPDVDGRPVQVVAEPRPVPMPVVDLTHYDPEETQTHASRLVGKEVKRPFDLTRQSPVRALLLRLDEEAHTLVLVFHHVSFDGWSQGVLWRELWGSYAALCGGSASALHELGIQYADFASWQRNQLKDGFLDRQLSYWKGRLGGGLEELALPTDSPRPTVQYESWRSRKPS
ncbi:condensation domain-containing protein, partial [Thermodesulfobacteriota bacterium]